MPNKPVTLHISDIGPPSSHRATTMMKSINTSHLYYFLAILTTVCI